ncbi:MAG TPA: BREX system ATP-binding domain-containing protein [Verrucomicrobiae bacterium]
MNLTKSSARCAIRHLKRGVFPPDEIEHFTAGRDSECKALNIALKEAEQGGNRHFFIEASYGVGKSHMLKLVESLALRNGFAVCWVTTDGYAHAFNHPTRYLHTLLENMRVPGLHRNGFAQACSHWLKNRERDNLLTRVKSQPNNALHWPIIRMSMENGDEGDYKDYYLGNLECRDLQHRNGQAFFDCVYDRIASMNSVCRSVSLKGTVFLFDEVESVATLLVNIRSRLLSYELMNAFTDARRFPNSVFVFATTLDFSVKIHYELNAYELQNYAYPEGNRFAKKWISKGINLLKLEGISQGNNRVLLRNIRTAHETAYEWVATEKISDHFIDRFLKKANDLPQREITRSFVTILEISHQHPTCCPATEFLGEASPTPQIVEGNDSRVVRETFGSQDVPPSPCTPQAESTSASRSSKAEPPKNQSTPDSSTVTHETPLPDQNLSSFPQLGSSTAPLTTPNTGLLPCVHCFASVRSDRMGRHIARFHAGLQPPTNVAPMEATVDQPGKSTSNSAEGTFTSTSICLVPCNYCFCMVRSDRLQRHIQRVHSGQHRPPSPND